MVDDRMGIEEHELPFIEAVLAATLALMSAYSQALQADLHPRQRLAMSSKIVANLTMLGAEQLPVSAGFRNVLGTLRRCWQSMHACTCDATVDRCGEVGDACTGQPAFPPDRHESPDTTDTAPCQGARRLH